MQYNQFNTATPTATQNTKRYEKKYANIPVVYVSHSLYQNVFIVCFNKNYSGINVLWQNIKQQKDPVSLSLHKKIGFNAKTNKICKKKIGFNPHAAWQTI